MARYTQVKRLVDLDSFRTYVGGLGIEIPAVDSVAADGAHAQPLTVIDGALGEVVIPNRWTVLPMEGWDGEPDGSPSDLVRRRWDRFASSGAGLVWGEATAVRADGRANPNQLVLDETTVDSMAALRSRLASDQVAVMQLTHSGRYSRPSGAGPAPRTVYEHRLLDARVGSGADEVFSDTELDELADQFVERAHLVHQAGFEFVDIKACHGYLGHELLSAVDRPGRYGGDIGGRSHFMRSVVERIRSEIPGLGVAVRLSIFDLVPHVPGDGGVGVPETDDPPFAFGGDGTGLGYDLTEPHELLHLLAGLGVGLVSVTASSPYYAPHGQRPAYFPPSDGYQPPEDPLVGVARLQAATRELSAEHPSIRFVSGGMSYLQDWLPHVGEAMVAHGWFDSIGLGRMALSYPNLPADVCAGRELERRRICRTFSDCTTAPRGGLVSGCYPLDDFYKEREERVQLAAFKKGLRARLR